MADKYLLLSADHGDPFCKEVWQSTPEPNSHPLVRQTGSDLNEGLVDDGLAVVIHLTPKSCRSACLGFNTFLRLKEIEHKLHCRTPLPSRVIPTIFCSFFPDREFERRFKDQYPPELREFVEFLCACHLRIPFDSTIFARTLAHMEERAGAMKQFQQLSAYRTATKELISDHRPHGADVLGCHGDGSVQ